nr:Do family serine endopeptidase [uncultured Steroidobacter sp.]
MLAATRTLAITIALSLTCAGPIGPIALASANGGETGGSTGAAALPDFSQLAAASGRSVVNVTVIEKQAARASQSGQDDDDDPFSDFFRRFGAPQQPPPGPARDMGSGFIVSPDGYILTNAHLVVDASDITVKLIDRREFPAKVVGVDARTDVAVLKIEARDLPVAKFGDATKLQPGEWVIAIGAPFGFENSVTAGVVSGTARSLPENDYVPFIQTDVAVNPGNSGGPLIDLQGEVVGINSQIYSRSGGYMGLAFAIPIDVARNVEQQLIQTGHVRRGRLGLSAQEMNAQLAQSFGLDRARGGLVSSVDPDGPAARAGIKPGDVILRVNDQAIEHSNQLPPLIAGLAPDSTATLQIWRDRAQTESRIRIAELQEPGTGSASEPAATSGPAGLSVRPLTPKERQSVDTRGSLVIDDVSGSAAKAGLVPGDIVLAVNGKTVKSVKELERAIHKAGPTAALLIQREDAQIFVPIQLEGSPG